MIHYTCYIKVFADGKRMPYMEFFGQLRMLHQLGADDFQQSASVEGILQRLRTLDETNFSFAPSESLLVDVIQDKVEINCAHDSFAPFSITRGELINIYEDWLQFLQSYEENRISGVDFAF